MTTLCFKLYDLSAHISDNNLFVIYFKMYSYNLFTEVWSHTMQLKILWQYIASRIQVSYMNNKNKWLY